jgi:TRAP-type C4-dicarboxylate transport system substrate-binding protein
MHTRALKITTCLVALALAAGCGGSGDKAGGGGGVKTLTLATGDSKGRPASDDIQRFADEVERRSNGRLRVRITWEANVRPQGGYKPGADREIVELLRSGKYDLAVVPARAWDMFGVRSFTALQTPFLITSDALMARVARDPMAARMLDGLEDAGVVGLALLPEALRHPVGFGHPLVGPRDYAGKAVRVLPSDASFDLFRAFGARPVDLNGAYGDEVAGTESSFSLASTLPARGTTTSNVTLFPKLNTLVAQRGAFDGLSDEDRRTLREAAHATLGYVLATNPTDAEAGAAACRAGYAATAAPEADVAALESMAAPLVSALEHDPATAPYVERIRALKADTEVEAGAPVTCAGAARPPAHGIGPGTPGPTPIDGVYRWTLDEREMIGQGVEPGFAYGNSGLMTVTLHDGAIKLKITRNPAGDGLCTGSYKVAGRAAEIRLTSDGCQGHFRLRWQQTRDGLRTSDVVSLPPIDAARDKALDRVQWSSKPWKRIGGAAPKPFPEGVYRANVSERDLRQRGVSVEDAFNAYGLQTLTIEDGRFSAATRSDANPGTCVGDAAVAGERIILTADDIEVCGTAKGHVLFSAGWRLHGDTLRFAGLRGDDPVIEALFGNRDWRRIG